MLLALGGLAIGLALGLRSGKEKRAAPTSITRRTTAPPAPTTRPAAPQPPVPVTTALPPPPAPPPPPPPTSTPKPAPSAGARLVLLASQSYCQQLSGGKVGFWITLANHGSDDATDVGVLPVWGYGATEERAPAQIRPLRVPADAPKLQTVVSYSVKRGKTVDACSLRVFSRSYARSGEKTAVKVHPPQ